MLNNLPPIRNLRRWRELQAILFRYGFDFLIDTKEVRTIQSTLRTLHLPVSIPESKLHELSTPERVRRMLQDMGPTYVKLGQILSSRSDFLPDSWVQELSKLQDAVPAFSFEEVERIIEEEIGTIEQSFLFVDPEPIAAASIGQVHYAILNDFSQVVIKVQRPKIEAKIQSDLEFVRDVAKLLHNSVDWGKKYGVIGLAEELIRTLMDELDYNIEATNADRLRRNMEKFPEIHVPYVYWDYTTKRVLTLEAIDGYKINDLESIATLDIDRVGLSKIFMHSILHQAFINGFFHADPHPGNLMVEKKTKRLVYLDTGMMGSLLPEQRNAIGEVVQAIIRRDTEEILRLALILGTPFQQINENKLRRDMDHMINHYLEAPLERLEVTRLLSEILVMIFEAGIRLPPVLGVSAKALLQAEDVARVLNPDVVVVEVMKDVAYSVYLHQINPVNTFWQTVSLAKDTRDMVRVLPRSITKILTNLVQGELKVGIQILELSDIISNILIIANRLIVGVVLVGMLVGSALAMSVPRTDTLAIVPIIGVIGFVIALGISLMMVVQVWNTIGRTRRWSRRRKKDENKPLD
jgi:ubiquinone biosynthesis protein